MTKLLIRQLAGHRVAFRALVILLLALLLGIALVVYLVFRHEAMVRDAQDRCRADGAMMRDMFLQYRQRGFTLYYNTAYHGERRIYEWSENRLVERGPSPRFGDVSDAIEISISSSGIVACSKSDSVVVLLSSGKSATFRAERPLSPALSPDATRLAFSSRSSLCVFGTSTGELLYRGDLHIAESPYAVSSHALSWSPDSSTLAYATDRNKVGILDVDRGMAEELAEGERPAWLPDGQTILFIQKGRRKGHEDIWQSVVRSYHISSRKECVLGQMDYAGGALTVAPDGKYLCFIGPPLPASIFEFSPTTSHVLRLMEISNGHITYVPQCMFPSKAGAPKQGADCWWVKVR